VDSPEDNFLLNSQNLDLGVRQNQEKVNDVILPPWAKGVAAREPERRCGPPRCS